MGWGPHAVTLFLSVCAVLPAADLPTFEKTVAPVLTKSCSPCHNESLASGGMNIAQFTQAASLTKSRDGWDIILRKIRAGEMPPKGIPRPAQMDSVIQYLQDEFEKADRSLKPDPGRVTARRLNRAEYSNTIRDLLGVEFHAEQNFPDGRSGQRLRQHRRRAHDLSGADGPLSRGCRQDRFPCHRRRSPAQASGSAVRQ